MTEWWTQTSLWPQSGDSHLYLPRQLFAWGQREHLILVFLVHLPPRYGCSSPASYLGISLVAPNTFCGTVWGCQGRGASGGASIRAIGTATSGLTGGTTAGWGACGLGHSPFSWDVCLKTISNINLLSLCLLYVCVDTSLWPMVYKLSRLLHL